MIEAHRLVFIAVFLIFGIFFCVWQHAQCFKLSRFLIKQEKKLKEMNQIERELCIKESQLSSLNRIEQIASMQLKLIFGSVRRAIHRHQNVDKKGMPAILHSVQEECQVKVSPSLLKRVLFPSKKSFHKSLEFAHVFQKSGFSREIFGPSFLQLADASEHRDAQVKKNV